MKYLILIPFLFDVGYYKSNDLSLKRLFISLFFLSLGAGLWSQSINTEFGKNRVQYHDDFDKWWMYETENFVTYWYGKGKNVAHSVVQLAEFDHGDIQSIMEHRINDKIQIIVFSDISDLKQSNIGLEETFEGRHKETKVIGSKMFVYYDGNHHNLRKQIRKGIAGVYLNSMFSGSSLQEIVKSLVKLNVPDWFGYGIVSYLSSQWDHLLEDELRDLWLREDKNYTDFDDLANDYPKIAGHSFWYYIDQNYGTSTISNLLYLTRINRDLENSFLFVLGTSLEAIVAEWKSYYTAYYENELDYFEKASEKNKLNLSNKKHAPISQFELNPDGTLLAYVHNDQGKYWVNLRDLSDDSETTLFKYGFKNILQEVDYNYPIVTWHPSGREISLVYEHHDRIYLRKIEIQSGEFVEQVLPENFQRIYSLSYLSDLEYIFSANTDGYSDLYIYRSRNRQTERITDDFWDDLDASYVQIGDQSGILFSSNRPTTTIQRETMDTIMPIDHFDVFFYPFETTPNSAIRITNTKNESERHPVIADGEYVTFLNSKYGINNRHIVNFYAPGSQYPNSNKGRNIIRHDASQSGEVYVYSYYEDGAYVSYIEYPDWSSPLVPHTTEFVRQTTLAGQSVGARTTEGIGVLKLDPAKEVLQPGFLFQTPFEDPDVVESLEKSRNLNQPLSEVLALPTGRDDQNKRVEEFVNARAVAARTTFKMENFTTRLDNEILFEGLESFAGQDKEFQTAPVGILLKAKMKDLFEDYQVEGGIRIPTTFNGHEYFLVVDDNKNFIDKRYAIYRKSVSEKDENTLFPTQKTKRNSLLGLFRAKYPLDIYRSLRATTILRFDNYFYLNSDEFSSNQPPNNEKRLSLRLEYVFDNTVDKDINLKHGSRYKVYVEAINRFNIQLRDGFEFDASKGFTTVIGLDARHYVPVLNHSVLALRGTAATSLGSDKILYYLGGVEGAVSPKFNQNIPIPPNQNFSYKTIAAHLRGFNHNIRNGTSFMLGNAELRIPIFKYLSKRKLRSSILRSIQVVGFYDIGTAWHGLKPSSENNPINSATVEQPPVLSIKVRYYRDPLVMAYGTGLRASLFGYFLRADYAWGVESRSVQEPKFIFSLGLDF